MTDNQQNQSERNQSIDWVVLGTISGLYGVRGWVKVFSHTSPRTNILNYPVWYLKRSGEWVAYKLENGRAQGKGIVAQLENCQDRDQAADLMKAEIAIPRDQLPTIGLGEYYWSDLEGLSVVTEAGVDLGKVESLFETGSNDVIVVKGERQRLLPFTQDAVKEVDLSTGVITVDWDPDF